MRAPYPKLACPLQPGWSAYLLLLAAGMAAIACEDAQPPTATRPPAQVATSAAEQATPSGVTTQNINLPVNQSVATASPAPAFRITQTGTGPNGAFVINNASNSQAAFVAQTNGLGNAGRFQITNSNSFSQAIYASTTGKGRAGAFQIFNASSLAPALSVASNANGPALSVQNSGLGLAGDFSGALTIAGSSRRPALSVTNNSGNTAAEVLILNTNSLASALVANTHGPGWAAQFYALFGGQGLRIQTSGGAGLQVIGGSKQAVVPTAGGARSLYTEESSEVWFTDYGFGQLRNGRARILIDPAFAQTVNLDQPYQVFVQAYGDADLYVKERTALGFEVVFRAGNDRQAEFGYRLVAKRRGFESARLEAAPWADDAVALSRPDR
jgi:hypothetical protein